MTTLQLTAAVDLQADAADKPARVEILAYTGQQIRLGGVEYVVDVDTLSFADSIPLLSDHDDSRGGVIGAGTVSVQSPNVLVTGSISRASAAGREIIQLSADGVRWQASVGVQLNAERLQRLRAGDAASINGRSFTASRDGLTIVRHGRLREVSIVATGADADTAVSIAAKGSSMADNATTTDINSEQSPAVLRAALCTQFIAEHPERRDAFELLEAKADDESWDAGKLEVELLRASRPPLAAGANRPQPFTPSKQQGQILAASLALTCGVNAKALADDFGEDVINMAMAKEHRGASLHSIMRRTLQAAGVQPPSERVTDSYIRAVFDASQRLQASGWSTYSVPGILSDAAHKAALSAFQDVPAAWPRFCAVGDVVNFKTHHRYRLLDDSTYEELGSAGELKHGTLDEEGYDIKASTWGKMFSITRQDIINDDLGVLATIPARLGRAGAVEVERQVFKTLMANGGDFFHSDNDNLLTGGGSVLAAAGLADAEEAFMMRVINDVPVMLNPSILLVPVVLGQPARTIVANSPLIAVGVGSSAETIPSANPWAGRFEVISSPWLQLETLSGYSETAWYLLAAPQGSAGLIEVAFLNGRRAPAVEQADMDFNVLGISMRGYHDFAVALQDGRFGVKNAGT